MEAEGMFQTKSSIKTHKILEFRQLFSPKEFTVFAKFCFFTFLKYLPSYTVCTVQFLWNSFYRKRLPQQNGDMRKRDLHAFKLHLEQGRLPSPLPRPPPTHAIRGWRALCVLPPPPPSNHALPMAEICDFQRSRPKARTASI